MIETQNIFKTIFLKPLMQLIKIIFYVFIPVYSIRKKLISKISYLLIEILDIDIIAVLAKEHRRNSGAKWLEVKDKFRDKRCFIIGSAPSVKQLDLTKLNLEYTFICNNGFSLSKLGLQKSTFYALSDGKFYEDFKENIDEKFSKYFFIASFIPWEQKSENTFFYDIYTDCMWKGHFQVDVQKPLANGRTVVLKMLQIAVYLGFKEIIFIGVDLEFTKENLHFYKSSNSELNRIPENLDIRFMLESFEYAKKFCDKKGVNLYNASSQGNLNCMPRIKFDDLFD
jgi:hypothetical protein